MKTDYTIIRNRVRALNDINEKCLTNLSEAGVELYKYASCEVSHQCVEIGIKLPKEPYTSAGSTISFYPKYRTNAKDCKINFGTSGSFTPKDVTPYWRTITAASILDNWKAACSVIEKSCKEYRELVEEIETATNE